MKRIFTFLTFTLPFVLAWGQSITSITPDTAVAGQTLSVTIMGQGTNFNTASGAAFTGGTPWMYLAATSQSVISPTELSAQFSIPPTASVGYRSLDLFPYNLFNSFYIGATGTGISTIQGKVYFDPDLNCSYGPGDSALGNRVVTFQPGPFYAITDSAGNYSAMVPNGNYTVTCTPGMPYYVRCPISQSIAVNVPNPGTTVSNVDFATDTTSVQDVFLQFFSLPIRAGMARSASILVYNYGSAPFVGDVTFITDPEVTPSNFSPAPNSISNDTMVWSVNMPPSSSLTLSMDLTGDMTLQLGDTVHFVCYADTTPQDINQDNNRLEVDMIVLNSYDPNDKAVSLQSGQDGDGLILPNDTTLIYRIRFQNTGTDTAFTVVLRDTMDANLDLSTLQVLSSSHPWQMSLDAYGRVEFSFPNILLPDSFANEPASNGYILYRVNRFPNLADNTPINNTAGIYFDFNPPVITNTVSSVVCAPASADFNHAANLATVTFTDQSSGNIVSRSWDFGDGNTSTAINPTHTYTSPGLYNVCLTTSTTCRSETHCEWVNICQEPTAAYQSTPNQLNVNFTDQSSSGVTQWQWNFGDGNSSTVQNPSHTYALPGSYVVCLTVTDSCTISSFCDTINVTCAAPSTNFTASSSLFQATFSNTSSGQSGATYAWDFGDGNTSTQQNPSHTYTSAGSYVVCLTTTDFCGSSTFCDTVMVTCPAPGPSFSSTSSLFQASFSDQSTGNGTLSYAWDFGDGNTSTQQNPSHTYTSTGFYQVCLTVTDLCGSASFCDLLVITCPAPTPAYTWSQSQLQASFSNQSTGQSGASYLWDFGDGNTSTQASPTHTYATDGDYLTCLTITDDCGSATFCDTVVAVCAPPQAALNYTVNGLQVQFNDNTAGTVTSLTWDFGDGNTSTASAPAHAYAGGGPYTVCLQVENECGARDTHCVTLPLLVGIENSGPFRTISLYPNPNSGRFTLETELDAPGHLVLRVFDLQGKRLAEMDQGEVQGSFRTQIDLGEMPQGNYFLQFDLDGRRVNRILGVRN